MRDVPGARLHLTHVSTAAALAQVRAAKAAGLPVTCDVTPHHLALTDEWIAGLAALGWDAVDGDGRALRPVGGRLDHGGAVRPVAAGQPAAPARGGRGGRASPPCVDGTADAIATDHAPHTEVDKHVEFGWAANGISGIETAIGLVLAAVDAGVLPLARAIEALTTGPAAGPRARGAPRPSSFRDGDAADLVVIDRGASLDGRRPMACGRRARTRRCWAASCPASCG